MKVSGLIIGTRKAGTTWLYENLLSDECFCVSHKVKESGFFAGNFDYGYDEYLNLYKDAQDKLLVEVDASICYSDSAPELIRKHAPNAKIILILRNPVEYLVSRYIHSFRKGEIQDKSLTEAYYNNLWFRHEVDYKKIIDRFSQFDNRQLLTLSFSFLENNNTAFYKKIIEFISSGKITSASVSISERKNISRHSRLPFLSKKLSYSAKLARKYNLHNLVNIAKKTGVLKILDTSVNDNDSLQIKNEATKLVETELVSSMSIWKDLEKK